MKTFKYTKQNSGLIITAVFILIIFDLFILYKIYGTKLLAMEQYKMLFIFLGTCIPIILLLRLLKKLFTTQVELTASQNGLQINNKKQQTNISWHNVLFMRINQTLMQQLLIYNTNYKCIAKIDLPNAQSKIGKQQPTAIDFIDYAAQFVPWVKANEKIVTGNAGNYSVNYVAPNYLKYTAEIDKIIKKKDRKLPLIIFSFIIIPLVYIFISMIMRDNKTYEIQNGQVYYGDEIVENTNAKEFDKYSFGYGIAKDSNHIFIAGKMQPQFDRNTFKALDGGIFTDKNGVYKLDFSAYRSTKLSPLEGNYDKKSFQSVGALYKDKDHIYNLDYMAGKLETQDDLQIDVKSFKEVQSLYLYADTNAIYIYSFKNRKLSIDKRLDRASFEIIDYYVIKDKNNVYYNAEYLKHNNNNTTNDIEYKLLAGANATTFKKINDNLYQDKNTDWTIMKDGDKINFRK